MSKHAKHLGPSICERITKTFPASKYNEGWTSVTNAINGHTHDILVGTERVYAAVANPFPLEIDLGGDCNLKLW